MKQYLSVISDGTRNRTKVVLPNGMELKCTRIAINLVAQQAEELTVTFYLSRQLWAISKGIQEEDGLFLDDGSRLDGVCSWQIEPITQNTYALCTAMVYPLGSLFGKSE